MGLIEVNYSQQDLHLDFKKETGDYVDNIATNLNNPYIQWLEEIAIKARKADLVDAEIRKCIMEEIVNNSDDNDEEKEDSCDCQECHCHAERLSYSEINK